MYLHKHYDIRAVPKYLPVYNEVQHLDEEIDAIARGKYFAKKRYNKQFEKISDGFERIKKHSERLSQMMTTDKKKREIDEINFGKDLEMTAKTMADINESNWRQSIVRRDVETVKEFKMDEILRDRLVENNMKAFDRLQILKART